MTGQHCRGVARNSFWVGIIFLLHDTTVLYILAAWRHRLQLVHKIISRDWFWEGIYTDIPPRHYAHSTASNNNCYMGLDTAACCIVVALCNIITSVLPGLGATQPSKCLIFYKQLESEKQIHVNNSTMCSGTQGATNTVKGATTRRPTFKWHSYRSVRFNCFVTDWALVIPDGVAPSRMVGVSASVNLPLHHKVQKFSSGTGSPE